MKIPSQVIIAAMKFKGDISGIFFLIFPRELALVALEAMLEKALKQTIQQPLLMVLLSFAISLLAELKLPFQTKIKSSFSNCQKRIFLYK